MKRNVNREPETEKWVQFHTDQAKTNYPKWPNEAMVKILFGSYLKRPVKIKSDSKVLDVGCGFGNNLLPFLDAGCECHGVEIDPDIAALTQTVLNNRGFSSAIKSGSNCSLSYDGGVFDLVLSINTLHYEGSEENILNTLCAFRRVLKQGGVLYISTVGPNHDMYRRAEPLGHHRYRIRNFDFRDGQEFFFFDNEQHLEYYCKKVFEAVETGRVTERLMTLPLDFLIGVCR